jgi:hypothetical protein
MEREPQEGEDSDGRIGFDSESSSTERDRKGPEGEREMKRGEIPENLDLETAQEIIGQLWEELDQMERTRKKLQGQLEWLLKHEYIPGLDGEASDNKRDAGAREG